MIQPKVFVFALSGKEKVWFSHMLQGKVRDEFD